ncbi:MAG TPA: hypothetical protein VF999_06420 [Thermoanaerobaculia bacterium]
MTFVRNFLSIVGAALGSSILGGLFGCIVAVVSPEFVKSLTAPPDTGSLVRYAAGLGMVWGLFLGTAVMGFSLLIAAVVRLTKALDANRSRDRAA